MSMSSEYALAQLRALFDEQLSGTFNESKDTQMINEAISLATAEQQRSAYTDQQLIEHFGPIFARIAEGAVAREEARELPYEPVRWLREAGFGRLRIPRHLGGFGLSLPQQFRLITLLAEADSNLPQIFRAHLGFIEGRLNDLGHNSDEWFARIVAGDLFGAAMAERGEATANTVTLTAEGNNWRLHGKKYYCTGTLYADWIAVSASLGDEHVNVAVPTTAQGVTRLDDWDGFGQRLTASGTTEFEQVLVKPEQIVRRFNIAELRQDSYISAFYQQVHLATLAGIARAVLRDAREFVQGRTRTFGIPGQSSPRHDPLVQQVIGRLSSLAFSTQSLVEAVSQVLEDVWQAHLNGGASADLYAAADIRAYEAQQIILGQVLEASSLLFEVGGASATSITRRFDRHWRNARTLASHNPAVLRAAYLGDYYLNGTIPSKAWAERYANAKGQDKPAANEGDLA